MNTHPIISITVPISKVYIDVYRSFWQQLGCQVETEAQPDSAHCTITFPPGTRRELRSSIQEPRFLLRLPDQTTVVEEVDGRGWSYLYAPSHHDMKQG